MPSIPNTSRTRSRTGAKPKPAAATRLASDAPDWPSALKWAYAGAADEVALDAFPLNRIAPEVDSISPTIISIVVVFPDPLGPR